MRLFTISMLAASWMTTGFCGAAVVEDYPVGASAFWTTGSGSGITWTSLGATDVQADYSPAEDNLVGDATNAGLYWAKTSDYVFFRMRVDVDVAPAADKWTGSHFLLIDVIGQGRNGIDYGFTWDAKSNSVGSHGLEMQVWDTAHPGTTWATTQMDDLDGLDGSKGTVDINGGGRTADGYIRTTDEQATTNFANTTFIDFAVSWNYMKDNVPILYNNRDWLVTAASITNATDHNVLKEVMGVGSDLTGAVAGSSAWSFVPEPSSALAGLLLGAGLLRRRRA